MENVKSPAKKNNQFNNKAQKDYNKEKANLDAVYGGKLNTVGTTARNAIEQAKSNRNLRYNIFQNICHFRSGLFKFLGLGLVGLTKDVDFIYNYLNKDMAEVMKLQETELSKAQKDYLDQVKKIQVKYPSLDFDKLSTEIEEGGADDLGEIGPA